MKKFYPLFTIIVLAICVDAQTSTDASSKVASNSSPVVVSTGSKDVKRTLTKNSKVEILPEKARP